MCGTAGRAVEIVGDVEGRETEEKKMPGKGSL
jgi:hypothetical protein